MKKCVSCDLEFETGKFCKKCGSPLVEIEIKTPPEESDLPIQDEVQDVSKPDKKVKKEKKVKTKKEKKKFRPLKFLFFLLLFTIIACVAFVVYYLNQSQISFDNDFDFDDEAFYSELNNEVFDGESIEIELDKDAILFFIDENYDDSMIGDLPLGLEIGDIGYDDDEHKLLVQVDGGIVHTTLELGLDVHQVDQKLLLDITDVTLGKWHVKLPYSMIENKLPLPKEMTEGVDLPKYVSVEGIDYSKDTASFEILLDLPYFTNHLKSAFDNVGPYLDFAETYSNDTELFLEYYDRKDNWDDYDTKEILKEMNTNTSFTGTFFMMLNQEFADDLINQIVEDTVIDLPKSLENLDQERKVLYTELEHEINTYIQETNYARAKEAASEIYESIDDYFDSLYINQNIISVNGYPYSVNSSEFLNLDVLRTTVGYQPPADFNYEIYSKNNKVVVGVNTPLGFVTYDQQMVRKDYDDVNDADAEFNTRITQYTYGSTLSRGDNDRAAIAEVVSDFIYSDNSIFIRYLKSDGKWAVLIASPGDYSQSVSEYILEKVGTTWVIRDSYASYENTATYIATDWVNKGFNVTLLPPYEMKDFKVWNYAQHEIDEITSHLYRNDYTSSLEEYSFFSRIDDTLVISTESGKRFIYVFEPGSKTDYIELVEVKSQEYYTDYLYLLNQQYYGNFPTFVYLQD